MPRRSDENLFGVLLDSPWWASVIVAVVWFVGFRYVLAPAVASSGPLGVALAPIAAEFSWLAIFFLLAAPFAAVKALLKARRLDEQTGVDSINAMSWREFEQLLGEAYRRQGFAAEENSGAGPDGGVDLVLRRGGQTYLVQCKQWRTKKVGVKVIREMLGLVTAHSANAAIVVTSGGFTAEAHRFAKGQPLELVEGEQLLQMIRSVQSASKAAPSPAAPAARVCPDCGSPLVLRTARRGSNAGGRFWGCSAYPRCRHTEVA